MQNRRPKAEAGAMALSCWLPAICVGAIAGRFYVERNWPADLYRNSPHAECRLVTTARTGEPPQTIHAVCGREEESGDALAFWSYPETMDHVFLKPGSFRPVTAKEFRRLVGSKYWRAGFGEFASYHQARLRIRLDGDIFRIEQEYDKDEYRSTTNSAYTTDGRDIAWLKRDYYDQNCFTYRVLERDRFYR